MEDIERLLKIVQDKRLVRERKLKDLDLEPVDHQEMMRNLQEMIREKEECMDKLMKHFNMITAHKHFIHKIISSSKDISGLPVPHNYAQDVKTMFTDAIGFMNNIENTHKVLNNTENNINPSKLIEAVMLCTEAAGSELYQTKCRIAQLETLKEDIAVLQQHMLNSSSIISDESNITINGESINSESTKK